MNPPSALHSAMSRERKPFTYTPGGLDLSEIKSERMAARLMRNAMNQGVPELPPQHNIQSPPTPSTPIAVPNFNCLPVQVFPAFNLPANPKSLLRTRSNPSQPREPPAQRVPPPAPPPTQLVNNSRVAGATQYDTFNKNTPTYSQINNNRPVSMYEYGSPANTMNYGSDGYTAAFPATRNYEVEYFQMPKNNTNVIKSVAPPVSIDKGENNVENNYSTGPLIANEEILLPPIESSKNLMSFEDTLGLGNGNNNTDFTFTSNALKDKSHTDLKVAVENKEADYYKDDNISDTAEKEYKETAINIYEKLDDIIPVPETIIVSKPIEDLTILNNEKKEVKIVKKQVVQKESEVEQQNGAEDQNGDTEIQAVVKIPTKKSAAKTETKVEVSRKTLPDGSVEEVKKTITKTTIDGRTEIKTKTETTIIPKEDDEDEVEEVEEEEEEESADVQEVEEPKVTVVKSTTEEIPKENGQENIIKTEERSETTTTTSKKVVIVEDNQDDQNEEEEEEVIEEVDTEDVEPVTVVLKKPVTPEPEPPKEEVVEPEEEEEEIEVESKEEKEEETIVVNTVEESKVEEQELPPKTEEVEEEEEYEEAEETVEPEEKEKTPELPKDISDKKDDDVSERINEDVESEKEKDDKEEVEESKVLTEHEAEIEEKKEELKQEVSDEKHEIIVEKEEIKSEKPVPEEIIIPIQKLETPEPKVNLREPSVPLEKVEDVEIKPIGSGDFITKTHTENTEIITNVTEKPTGLLTEINRVENIVTVNRTTKVLDNSYETITQQGIPTVKTYFTPYVEPISTSPQPSRPYQPVYPSQPQPTTERRHSLLLERLSVERQMPSDIYQNNYQYSNQVIEQQRQLSQEPQAEVLTVSNVKPSQITNQQWYQQRDSAIYNNRAPSPQPTSTPIWAQPKPQPQPQPQYQAPPQPQYQAPPQPQYQPPPQPQYQPPPQPQYQAPPQPQYQAPPQPQYQAPPQPQYQAPPQPQQQYQPSYTENVQESSYQNSYSSYTPKPTNWASNTSAVSPIPTIITPSQQNQYSYLKDSSESYKKTTQQYSSSSYVPPPWEQDSAYVPPEIPQNYYQPPPQSTFSPAPNQSWKPPTSKFSKPPPTAYIPPKPNQSFVKPVTELEPPRLPGRKTYYSEYERRYISVPESTYIPAETKFQPQPDPSPKYYYDNNEPSETVEPQWRKELREFTEKTQTQTQTETNIKPPWEGDVKYAKTPEATYTATPTWSQTVRPQSWRERSFESEYVSQEWPKTNTLGRGRPLSSYGKESVPERTRGVSVDRYNPNSYQSPLVAEHPPVQTHTHIAPAPLASGYHNPNVPAYHARASAEPREQPVSYQQPRHVKEARASPFQSRSFKYLQWITGTDD